jgi:hypothetical protein
MSEDILKDAIKDAKMLRETAMESAKNYLLEAISPQLDQKISQLLGEGSEGLEEAEVAFEVGSPVVEAEDELAEAAAESLGEAKMDDDEELDEAKKKDEDEDLDEVVEFTNEEFKAALSEALKEMKEAGDIELSEAKVSKAFGDVQDPTPKSAGGKGESGILDMKSGEHHFKDEVPPAAKDWTVKEAAYKNALSKQAKQLDEYKKAYGELKGVLQEVTLFNQKLIYTNKLLQNEGLSSKMKRHIVETMDTAQTTREVEFAFKALSESLKLTGVLAESRQKLTPKLPRGSRLVKPGATVLSESAQRDSAESTEANSWLKLAGLE